MENDVTRNAGTTSAKGMTVLGKIGFTVLGLLFIAAAVRVGSGRLYLQQHGSKAIATVVGSPLVQATPDSKPFYHAEYRFTAADGNEYTATAKVPSRSPVIIGAKEYVYYDPQNPQSVSSASLIDLWLIPAALLAVGIVLILGVLFTKSGVPKK